MYMSNTTIFIGSILSINYIRHNYMFRPWMLAIVRLYIKTYPDICGLFIGDWEVVVWVRDLVMVK